jgi:hypothetical protein
MQPEKPQHESAPWTTAALWTGVFLAPVAWAVHLQFVYAVSQQACTGKISDMTLHIVSLACAAAAVAGGLLAAWHWFKSGAQWPSDERSDLIARRRFLSSEGILSSVLFALIIVGQWLAIVFLSPCPP